MVAYTGRYRLSFGVDPVACHLEQPRMLPVDNHNLKRSAPLQGYQERPHMRPDRKHSPVRQQAWQRQRYRDVGLMACEHCGSVVRGWEKALAGVGLGRRADDERPGNAGA